MQHPPSLAMQSNGRIRPLKYAGGLAVAYVLVSGLYIVFSGRIAAAIATGREDLRQIEQFKGLVFVVATGALLFLLSLVLFRRVERASAQLVKQQEILFASERQAIAGVLAASVAHDFKNVLTVLGGYLDEMSGAANPELMRELKGAVRQGTELANRLSGVARPDAGERPRDIELAPAIERYVQALRLHPKIRRCEVSVVAESACTTLVYRAAVEQAVLNLVLNAAEAVGEKGRIEVRIRRVPDGCAIEVHDDGPGIDPANRTRVFEAFFTTKEEGTGLGLSSAAQCAHIHGGEVELAESPLGGALFRLTLRRAEDLA